ncbi:hypothetical protein ACTXT7_000309 [Hymenolepis weldensis]
MVPLPVVSILLRLASKYGEQHEIEWHRAQSAHFFCKERGYVHIGKKSIEEKSAIQLSLQPVEFTDLSNLKVDDIILRPSRMKCLPVTMAACLVTSTNRSSLDELAKTAYKILELDGRAAIHSVETPAPILVTPQQPDILTRLLHISSNPQNQFCYYYRTYGDDAKKGQIGCKYPKIRIAISQGNTIGSEYARALQRTSRLTDDSSPVQEDIRDFLPEHATGIRKTVDKRKRKTSKPAAASQ